MVSIEVGVYSNIDGVLSDEGAPDIPGYQQRKTITKPEQHRSAVRGHFIT